jgi:hypothetical protein
VLVALVAFVAGCTDDEPPPPARPEPVEFGAEVYTMVIERFLPPPDPDAAPVVYVVPVNGDPLGLDLQVAVIDALSDGYDVRFVDEVAAAVDDGSSDEPPRDEGMLIGLGRIASEPPHTIRVERYEDSDRVDGHLLTLEQRAGTWVVADEETVTPEVLIGDG